MTYERHKALADEYTAKMLSTSTASKKREYQDKARHHRSEAERLRKPEPPAAGVTQ